MEEYPSLINQEIHLHKKQWGISDVIKIKSIFLGGGTPSFLIISSIRQIIDSIMAEFNIMPDAEITIEANPESLTLIKTEEIRQIGINRLSLGVQSFDADELITLGRIHTLQQIENSLMWIKQVGFSNFNIDLMFGIPGQTLNSLRKNLETAISYNPPHLSLYNLTIHDKTLFYSRVMSHQIELPSEEIQSEMFLSSRQLMKNNNFEHYEISNYAKRGYRCLHNEVYWKGGSYLGLGPSAHSFITGVRFMNKANLSIYKELISQNILPIDLDDKRDKKSEANELLLTGIRLSEGIDINDIKNKTGYNLSGLKENELTVLLKEELIERDLERIKLTERGLLLCDYVIQKLML